MPAWQVTQRVFSVSRFKVWSAKLHAGTRGGAAKVPPSVASFRIKPEAGATLNAFANDTSNVQLLAHNKCASHVSVALKQVACVENTFSGWCHAACSLVTP